jgi:hypothetical protein
VAAPVSLFGAAASVLTGIAAYIGFHVGLSYRRTARTNERRCVAMDFGKNFKSMNGHVPGRLDSEFHLVAVDADDENSNVVTDHDGLIRLAAKHEHNALPGWPYSAGRRGFGR